MVYLKVSKNDLESHVNFDSKEITSMTTSGMLLTEYRDGDGNPILIIDGSGDDVFIIK